MIKINGIKINPTIFPDNTSQIWKLPDSLLMHKLANVTWEYETEAEIMHMIQLDLLLQMYQIVYILHIPYLPYARQDKIVDNHKTFALQAFKKVLDLLSYSSLKVLDIHTNEKLPRCTNTIPDLKNLKTLCNVIVYPDRSAARRYSTDEETKIVFDKKRCSLTGSIKSLEFEGNVKGKTCLIIDDICDGGATFIKCAQKLYLKGARDVKLYTTHGIYSKGLQCLKDAKISTVYNHRGKVYGN